jgi:hypothetical protein
VLTGKTLPLSSAIRQATSSANPTPSILDTQRMHEIMRDSGSLGANSGPTASSGSDVPLPVAKELLNLVQQQLHTLEHHHLVWMGQVWPGQQMQWEIQGEPEHHQNRQQDERQWSTEMELALPKLGDIHARLVFAESGLRLTLQAADSKTVELFSSALPQLKNSLADADIALLAAVVEKT